jgi:hypothetical protein
MGVAVIYYLTVVIVVVVLAWIILTGYRFHRKACNYRDRLERLERGPCPRFPECNCGSDDLASPARCACMKFVVAALALLASTAAQAEII